jgi:hypothetical protein
LSSSWLSTQSALPSAARLLIPHRMWRQPREDDSSASSFRSPPTYSA